MQFSTPSPWPTTTTELDPSEQLVVWSFRRWVRGLQQNDGDHWALVWNEFSRQFGAADGKAALSGFASVIKCLQSYARRNIRHHQPCCPCLCADEVCLLNLFAACQSNRYRLAKSLAEWMIEADGVGDILQAASHVAEIMRRRGLVFPVRTNRMPAGVMDGAQPHPVTLH